MAPGAVVDMPYQIDGDKLILPPGTTKPDAKPQIYLFRIDGDTLYERGDGMQGEVRLVRLTKAKPGDAPIVGTWKFLVDESAAKGQARLIANATYTYTKDGVCKLRVPFTFVEGTYKATDSKSGTLTVASKKDQTYAYRVVDGKLYLTQPDAKSEDVYVREDND
jgi:hypothetical protein